MKKWFLIVAILQGFMATAQHTLHWDKVDPPLYKYVNLSIDPNKIFNFNENPRTQTQNKGIDFDAEIGARTGHVAVFIYYGQFEAIKYQNYGAGVDYFVHWLRDSGIEFSGGLSYGSVLRQYEKDERWANYLGYSARIKTVYWILEDFAVELKFQRQERNDIGTCIYEGTVGATYKFD